MSGQEIAAGGAKRGWRERWRARRSLETLCELPGWRGSLFRWTAVAWGMIRLNIVLALSGGMIGYGFGFYAFAPRFIASPRKLLLALAGLLVGLGLIWLFLPRELKTRSRHAWLTRLFIRYDRWEAKLLNSRSQWSPEDLAVLDRVVGGWRGVAWIASLMAMATMHVWLRNRGASVAPALFLTNWVAILCLFGFAIVSLVNTWFSYLKYRDRLVRGTIITLGFIVVAWLQNHFIAENLYKKLGKSGADQILGNNLETFLPMLCSFVFVSLIALVRNREHDAQIARLSANAARQRVAHQLTSSQLRLLQAQIEPHFLFNSLGAVQHLVDGKAPEAAALNASLIRFLRGSMQSLRTEFTTLGDEKKLIGSYLEIMKARMGERLDYAIDFPAELLAQPVPPTMLITLVENAIRHGIEPKPEGGRVEVKARMERGRLRLTVADSGRGFSDLVGEGAGLANIRERLALRYGKRAALELDERENRGFAAHIVLPLAVGALPEAEPPPLKMAA